MLDTATLVVAVRGALVTAAIALYATAIAAAVALELASPAPAKGAPGATIEHISTASQLIGKAP